MELVTQRTMRVLLACVRVAGLLMLTAPGASVYAIMMHGSCSVPYLTCGHNKALFASPSISREFQVRSAVHVSEASVWGFDVQMHFTSTELRACC